MKEIRCRESTPNTPKRTVETNDGWREDLSRRMTEKTAQPRWGFRFQVWVFVFSGFFLTEYVSVNYVTKLHDFFISPIKQLMMRAPFSIWHLRLSK